MSIKSPPRLLTPGVIADELDEPLHRVLHILATRSHIKPRARAGILRLYDRQAVGMVREALRSIDDSRTNSRRQGGQA